MAKKGREHGQLTERTCIGQTSLEQRVNKESQDEDYRND